MDAFNKEIDNLLHHDVESNTLHGKVCLVCDKFIKRGEQAKISVKKFLDYAPYLKGDQNLPQNLRQSYCFQLPSTYKKENAVLNKCLLSPRSKIVYNGKRKRNPHIMCCHECRSGLRPTKLKKGELPRFAIANDMAIGTAPVCLTRLNEIELALLSQARFRGHLFTYWGGCHRSITGWHSFYEVDANHTTQVLNTVQSLTDAKNIAVVLCGPFTSEQKERVRKKIEVNVEWVLEAFDWLKENNRLYQNMSTPTIVTPVIIDNSEAVESENTDIEIKEQISVVFPNGTVQTGGYSDGVAFEKAVSDLRSKCGGTIPYLTSRPSRNILRDYEDENLMRAFPLQFPYGYGCHDNFNDKSSQSGYLRHLLYLSIPHFHEASFVLVIHNMFERCRALNGAIWRVMGGQESCDVSEEELNAAISRKLKGLPAVNGPGQQFLDSIHTVKKNMAHTNAAAQAAQAKFLSLTHYFGCPKVLFTVSFDDALDIRILALSGKEDAIDWVASLDTLPPDEVTKKLDELNALRFKYPGLCALNFEYLIDVVLDKIVGNNDLREGLFGKMAAFGMAVEEQGRKTLHAHILVYTLEWNDILKGLCSAKECTRRAAEIQVEKFVDTVMSTELTPKTSGMQKCPNCEKGMLNFAEPQQLRNLRHRIGCQQEQGILARCPECKASFEGNELAMMRATDKALWTVGEETVKSHVAREVLKATLPTEESDTVSEDTIGHVNYRYNHHLSHHTRTCFKKGDECRATLPDCAEPKTTVLHSDEEYQLFDWTGKVTPKKNITVRPKRLPQDAYTNTYCKAISASKAPANSNVSVTTGARSTIYASCYSAKGTQKEDTQELKKVASYVGNRFMEERKENTLFEGLSRLMGAVIVGTSEHVVSAPMASYLVRNQSRFKWSVNFKYVPVREIIDIITQEKSPSELKMSILGHSRGCFFTSEALHYLLRPKSQLFEDLCVVDFFQDYEIVRSDNPEKTDAKEGTFEIDNDNHPGRGKQIYRKRGSNVLAQFSHWLFPDAASFGGNIWEMSEYPVNSSVERMCRAILVLYHPFRTLEDLTIDGSFHKKFKRLYNNAVPHHIKEVLSNVQMFYNSM